MDCTGSWICDGLPGGFVRGPDSLVGPRRRRYRCCPLPFFFHLTPPNPRFLPGTVPGYLTLRSFLNRTEPSETSFMMRSMAQHSTATIYRFSSFRVVATFCLAGRHQAKPNPAGLGGPGKCGEVLMLPWRRAWYGLRMFISSSPLGFSSSLSFSFLDSLPCTNFLLDPFSPFFSLNMPSLDPEGRRSQNTRTITPSIWHI